MSGGGLLGPMRGRLARRLLLLRVISGRSAVLVSDLKRHDNHHDDDHSANDHSQGNRKERREQLAEKVVVGRRGFDGRCRQKSFCFRDVFLRSEQQQNFDFLFRRSCKELQEVEMSCKMLREVEMS